MLMWSVIAISDPGADLGAQRSGGIGQDQHRGSGRPQRADRGPQRVETAAFVQVRAALEHRHRDAPDRAQHRPPGVPGDGRAGKPGQVLVADDGRVLDGVGDRAEAGPEHDADARRAQAHAERPALERAGQQLSQRQRQGSVPGRPRYTGVSAPPNSASR